MDATADPSTTDTTPAIAGWMLVADQRVADVDPLLRRFGQVHRYPIDASAADAFGPGQPCFLVRTDRAKVIGLWAIGEVVAPSLAIDPEVDHPARGRVGALDADGWQCYAEVELLPLQKPIALAKLVAEEPLASSPFASATHEGAPQPLTARQVRAVEAFDFWIDEPSDEQRRALDALLDHEERELGIGAD